MNPIISAIINKALDGLLLRSAATAQNIANVNSVGYRPVRVSFEEALAKASARGEDAIRTLPLQITQADKSGSQPLRADLELATQSETALRYGALVDLLSRELQLQRTIIRGGQ